MERNFWTAKLVILQIFRFTMFVGADTIHASLGNLIQHIASAAVKLRATLVREAGLN